MASNHTPTYGLNQWSLEDSFIMEEFNTDNRNIEQALLELKAALPKFQSGSYVGTGTSGEDNPNTLEFDFQPNIIIIVSNSEGAAPNSTSGGIAPWFFVRPWNRTNRLFIGNSSRYSCYTYVTWLDNGVSWYAQHGDGTLSPANQLNKEGNTYYYYAFG